MQDGRANARPASVTAGDLDTGARIGRYVIIERVGTGAMGVVYGAYDPELDRKVALKLLKPGQGVEGHGAARACCARRRRSRASRTRTSSRFTTSACSTTRCSWRWSSSPAGRSRAGCERSRGRWREVLDVFIARGRGPGRRARGRARPPRLQARQRAARQGGPAARRRLRHRAPGGRRRRRARARDRRRRSQDGPRRCASRAASTPLATLTKTGTVGRHARVHGARAVPGRARRREAAISSASASRCTRRCTASARSPATTCSASRSTSPPSNCARCPRIAACRPGCGA